jgi:predicted acylesterase/phospholipase RssA
MMARRIRRESSPGPDDTREHRMGWVPAARQGDRGMWLANQVGGGRTILLGVVLILATPIRGVAWEGRGEPEHAGQRLGVVFAGGGAKAAYEAGLGLALHEAGLVPAAIAGTSAGAINAALLAAGEAERLAELWRTIRREDVFAYRAPVILGGLLPGWIWLRLLGRSPGLLDPAPLRVTLERRVDLQRVRASPVAVLVVATDLASGTPRRFDNSTLTLDALVASATVPGLFPPVVADDGVLVDGGVIQRAPVLELLEAHPLDRVIVVAAYAGEPPRDGTVQPVIERAIELALSREIERDVELARRRHPGVDIQVLTPSRPLRVRPFDFDGPRLAPLIELGRTDGRRCLSTPGHPD